MLVDRCSLGTIRFHKLNSGSKRRTWRHSSCANVHRALNIAASGNYSADRPAPKQGLRLPWQPIVARLHDLLFKRDERTSTFSTHVPPLHTIIVRTILVVLAVIIFMLTVTMVNAVAKWLIFKCNSLLV